jgi:hypothetical protein
MGGGDVQVECGDTTRDLDLSSIETEVKYEGYLRRQRAEVERHRLAERSPIPGDFRFERVPGLSREVVERLNQARPETLGSASRVPGITPAAVAVLRVYVDRAIRAAEAPSGADQEASGGHGRRHSPRLSVSSAAAGAADRPGAAT